jgi:hypothetical protein
MPTLPTSIIRDFAKKARHIKNRKITPITDFIKVEYTNEGVKLTKSNIENFVQVFYQYLHTFTGAFLFEETKLFNFVANINAPEFSFEQTTSGDAIVMKLIAGKTTEKFSTEAVINYPNMPAPAKETQELTQEHIDAITEAINFCDLAAPQPFMNHVNLQDKGIYGACSYLLYRNTISCFDGFLNADAVNTLTGAKSAQYGRSGSHTILSIDNTAYAFQDKDELKKMPIDGVINSGDAPCTITLNNAEITQFCNMVINSGDGVVIASIVCRGDNVLCYSGNPDKNTAREKEIQAIVKGDIPARDGFSVDYRFECSQLKTMCSLFSSDEDITMKVYPTGIVIEQGTITTQTQRAF